MNFFSQKQCLSDWCFMQKPRPLKELSDHMWHCMGAPLVADFMVTQNMGPCWRERDLVGLRGSLCDRMLVCLSPSTPSCLLRDRPYVVRLWFLTEVPAGVSTSSWRCVRVTDRPSPIVVDNDAKRCCCVKVSFRSRTIRDAWPFYLFCCWDERRKGSSFTGFVFTGSHIITKQTRSFDSRQRQERTAAW